MVEAEMFRRVLIPLDGSLTAQAILPRLRGVLAAVEAEVVLFHAVDLLPPHSPEHAVAELAASREQLDRRVRELKEAGVRARARAVAGPAAESILDAAAAEEATLVAMTTHGRSGLSRWVQGSVTEKVLRHSTVPLLVVHSFDRAGRKDLLASAEVGFRRILVPLDRGETSQKILPYVRDLGRRFDSRVSLLHVVGLTRGQALYPPREELEAVAADLGSAGVEAVVELRAGDEASQIVDFALSGGFDLVAMTTHGRSGVSRWLLGSVAEKVARAAPVPLLLVRA